MPRAISQVKRMCARAQGERDSMNEMQSVGVSRARHSISIPLEDQKPIVSIWRDAVVSSSLL